MSGKFEITKFIKILWNSNFSSIFWIPENQFTNRVDREKNLKMSIWMYLNIRIGVDTAEKDPQFVDIGGSWAESKAR